jgi:hypothetical protein
MSYHGADDGSVREVHVTPSLDVAAVVEFWATAQNTVPFHATEVQLAETGIVVSVHVRPSVVVALRLELYATAHAVVPFETMLRQTAGLRASGRVRLVQRAPSLEVIAVLLVLETASNLVVPRFQ